MSGRSRSLLAVVLMVLVTATLTGSAGWAAPMPSQSSCGNARDVDTKAVAAERELVKATLMDFGLTAEDAGDRMELLTDQEVHTLASDLESMQVAGDDIQWDTTTVLLVLILVVLIVS
jgi:hypothetical protein